jgi:hypothetical protein
VKQTKQEKAKENNKFHLYEMLTFSTQESLYSTMNGLRTLDISSICKNKEPTNKKPF